MEIRQARISDLSAFVAIEQENFSPEEALPQVVFEDYLNTISDTILVVEIGGQVAGYVASHARLEKYLTDDVFEGAIPNQTHGGFLIISSLAVSKSFQGQGVGTALLAALKDLAVLQDRQGISLTCHDYLIKYYEMNGFEDEGSSDSKLGGQEWFNMVWYPS